ncbi:MAG: NAD(P)H-dependent glycerol-3-phosphate dehydrogenase [Acidimicrobiia bacterium]
MNVGVIGAGSWGTTVASLAAVRANAIVWARETEIAEAIDDRHENPVFLPGHALSPRLRATDDLGIALQGAEIVIVAVPSRFFRTVVEVAEPWVPPDSTVVSVSKGIEPGPCRRMTEVLAEVLGCDADRLCVLTGPNLAREVMTGHPSATVVSSIDTTRAEQVRDVFMSEHFRVYTNTDVVGSELGGAVKNALAIAAGMADGIGFGWNTKAALITRALAELARLGVALGGSPLTFLGLAGNGDLIATCSSPLSRNRHVGEELGRGRSLSEILGEMDMVAEGVGTAPAVLELARDARVEMPITEQVARVLRGERSPREALSTLMQREAQTETHDLAI